MWQTIVLLFSLCCVTHLYVHNAIRQKETPKPKSTITTKKEVLEKFYTSPHNIISYMLIKE